MKKHLIKSHVENKKGFKVTLFFRFPGEAETFFMYEKQKTKYSQEKGQRRWTDGRTYVFMETKHFIFCFWFCKMKRKITSYKKISYDWIY